MNKKLFEDYRKILRNIWNPIGFGDILPHDEYNSYIDLIDWMLSYNISYISLFFHLKNLEDYNMGLKREKLSIIEYFYRIKRFIFLFKVVFLLKKTYNLHKLNSSNKQ